MPTGEPLQLLMAASLFVGGLLATIGFVWLGIVDPERTGKTTAWYGINAMVMAGGGLIAIGLPAVHAARSDEAGWTGAVGIGVLMAGMMVAYLAVQGIEMVNYGLPRKAVPLTFVALPCLAVGMTLTAFVSLRLGVVPPILPIALLVALVLGALTLLPNLSARANSFLPVLYTATFAAWGLWLLAAAVTG
jgi:hypothetical protein